MIGDACIAGTMPKSASAARSQALHCARAIAAELANHPTAPSGLDAVCYSMVGPDDAIVMRSGFELVGGEIVQARLDTPAGGPVIEPVRMADAWYAEIRAACFGDGPETHQT